MGNVTLVVPGRNITLVTGARGPKGPKGDDGDVTAEATAAAESAAASALAASAYDPTYRFANVAALLASTREASGVGATWQAGPHLYTEAAANATNHDLVTAGGVKLYVQANHTGDFSAEAFGMIGNDSTDNTAAYAIAAARNTANNGITLVWGPGIFRLQNATIPSGMIWRGQGRGPAGLRGTTVLVTGAPSAYGNGSGGGILMNGDRSGIHDMVLAFNNAALDCLLNVSASLAGGSHIIRNVDFRPRNLTSAAIQNTLAIYVANQTMTSFEQCQVGIFPGFAQCVRIRGFMNSCRWDNITLQKLAKDYAAGVLRARNYMMDIDASTQAMEFSNLSLAAGPNGVSIGGQGSIGFTNVYASDNDYNPRAFWMPDTAYTQDDLVYPSLSVTADATAGNAVLANVSSTANLYVNQLLKIPGAGASGALLTARITAISGSNVTVSPSPATTVSGATCWFGNYLERGYLCTVNGTSGASQPTWPTTALGSVADNTVTWVEFGPCAWLAITPTGAGKNNTIINSGIIFDNLVGILANKPSGQTNGAIKIGMVHYTIIDICQYIESTDTTITEGCHFNGYNDVGAIYKGTTGASNNHIVQACRYSPANGADIVAVTNSANMAGLVIGSGRPNITGPGAARWQKIVPTGTPPAYTLTSGYATDRALSSTTPTVTELANVLNTLIADLQSGKFPK